jgi:hypothetical protein
MCVSWRLDPGWLFSGYGLRFIEMKAAQDEILDNKLKAVPLCVEDGKSHIWKRFFSRRRNQGTRA